MTDVPDIIWTSPALFNGPPYTGGSGQTAPVAPPFRRHCINAWCISLMLFWHTCIFSMLHYSSPHAPDAITIVLPWKFDVSWLSKLMHMDCPKLNAIVFESCSYYSSASVPKWPLQKQSQGIKFLNFSGGACSQTPPSLACLCMHTYSSDTHVIPLLINVATGLYLALSFLVLVSVQPSTPA